jgi:hypothetical protein
MTFFKGYIASLFTTEYLALEMARADVVITPEDIKRSYAVRKLYDIPLEVHRLAGDLLRFFILCIDIQRHGYRYI